MKSFTKILSFALVMILMLGTCVISASADASASDSSTLICFEVPADWKDCDKIYCHIWEYGGDALAEKTCDKELCKKVSDGLYSFDSSAVGTLKDGVYYCLSFINDKGNFTYDLLFTTECLGHTVFCRRSLTPSYGPTEEKPAAVSVTYWQGLDSAKFGPLMAVSDGTYFVDKGEIIGTCLPPDKTKLDLFKEFLAEIYPKIEPAVGSQIFIDNAMLSLGLTKEEVRTAITEFGADFDWKEDAPPKVQGKTGLIYIEIPDDIGEFERVYCHIWKEENRKFVWQNDKTLCKKVSDNLYSYDVSNVRELWSVGIVEDSSRPYALEISFDTGISSYSYTTMDSTCVGKTLYFGDKYYDTIESSKASGRPVFWKDQDSSELGPIYTVLSDGSIGGTAKQIFNYISVFYVFLQDGIELARQNTGKSDQILVDEAIETIGISNEVAERIINNSFKGKVDWKNPCASTPDEQATPDEPTTPDEPHDYDAIFGDANGDDVVNVKDATYIQKAVAGLLTLTQTKEILSDVDHNGTVNVKDATMIQKWVAGLITSSMIGSEFVF